MTLSHISEVLPRAVPAPALAPTGTLRDLVQLFEMNDLRMTTRETIATPNRGEFAPTDWARRQLASVLGIRWDRWFASASPEERADEVNRRLSRRNMSVRLRTARAGEGSNSKEGVLRALVSPTFSPVPDSALARILANLLESADPRLATDQVHLTDRTVSCVVRVGEPFPAGLMVSGSARRRGGVE
jgi:hypothetical protein